ncbi:Phosphatidylinositolglycan class N-domain-containing protein [Fomitopsis serialis]|uniref:Phosphatidylinositolglycan class N-domain-containing protein n=1 Tax=Fomitopsis serialis TaxID=139415 RepID=UPI00200804F2|nr:Phosphatidylinositolglycan class N-domain-containing protein [Neoantrodia serialis]KAH9915518.1 Phosphatidylinositolglycan class N-domain-containing protein [Neoantrodia serialis]
MAARQRPIFRLLLIGLVFHLVYIGTVFDCYFTSPVVYGMRKFKLNHGEAKRLVLIVADGLRADLALAQNPFPSIPSAPEFAAPYLRSIIESRGAFGISHTHVPTESRPGHVALIGGMYEDVSAVTKGWKTNPVDFDSVFNQSSHTFSFGSPDILPMFARGATPGKVDMWCYDEDEEDFTKDATALDVWVLEHLRTLFHNATADPSLDATLHQGQTVFFLHLLGLDTTGHSYRPHSPEYMANIQVVDEIVHQVEQLFIDFYKDSETAFVFTADHGMSTIGNHGDGHPDNTRTPLVAWGKGVRGPLPDSSPSSHDDYSAPWRLGHLLRRDVEQADVAALMAALVGVHWPVNSVGVLPDVDPARPGYLSPDGGERTLAEAALVNARVVLEHYRVKHELEEAHTLIYKPFPYFASSPSDDPGVEHLRSIELLIDQGKYTDARAIAKELIRATLDGLRYLETYDRTLVRGIVLAAYLGWIAFGAVSIFLTPDTSTNGARRQSVVLDATALTSLVTFWAAFAKQRSPWTFYLYICFPVYFWHQALFRAKDPLRRYLRNSNNCVSDVLRLSVRGLAVVLALQSMVIGYTRREVWSAGFLVIGVLWPVLFTPKGLWSKHTVLLFGWSAACLTTAVFPMLSVDKQEDLRAMSVHFMCMLAAGVVAILKVRVDPKEELRFKFALATQCLFIAASLLVTISSARSLRAKAGLPPLNQTLGWAIFLVASAFPFFFRFRSLPALARLMMFFLAFSVCFVILSISVEGLFYFAFSATLLLWVEVEAAVRTTQVAVDGNDDGHTVKLSAYRPRVDDFRIAVFFLFFVQVAFFGTGNVASISSFYLEPVYRLVPVFNPFLMAVLLIYKIIAPYIILAMCLHLLNTRLRLPPFSLFLVALTLTDVMTMTFFFNVTDTGSWLEIGQSITFFVISSLLLVWAAGTCAVGELLMADSDNSERTTGKID